jgi:hypothetical protein
MGNKTVEYRNFETHHSQRSFTVFYFHARETADYFESCLIEKDIEYERGTGKDLIRRHLFGVHISVLDEVKEINNHTNEFFRKPFLGDLRMRNFVLIFTLIVLILAVVGYFMSIK